MVESGRVSDVAKGHADACRQAADSLHELQAELSALRAPIYDVPTALDILETGNFFFLSALLANAGSV